MNCRHFTSQMGDYLENDLDPECQISLDRHRAACPDCARFLNSYDKTIRAARSLPCGDPSEASLSRIRRRLGEKLGEVLAYY
jgi:anti-sigma factor RsiW